jgi:hypothetical protein
MVYLWHYQSNYTVSNDRMIINAQQNRTQKEVPVILLKGLSQHMPGGTEESHKNCQSQQVVSGMWSELWASRIQSKSTNPTGKDVN